MAVYHVAPLPLKTQVLRALSEACLPLAIEFALRPHRMTAADFVGQGIILAVLFFFVQAEGPYDLEVDDLGIRKVRNNQVELAFASERIRCVKESGRGPFHCLIVSERSFGWFFFRRIIVPGRVPEFEEIKTRLLSWMEHPRAIPDPLSPS